jgi:hypothetical protein
MALVLNARAQVIVANLSKSDSVATVKLLLLLFLFYFLTDRDMTRYCLFLSSLLLFLGISCHQKERSGSSESMPMIDKYLLKEDGIIKLELDTNTTYGSNCLQVIDLGKQDVMLYLNEEFNAIYFYDLLAQNGGQPTKILQFDREGPNGIPVIQGFHYHSPDSLFLFFEYNVLIADTLGHIKKKYTLASKDQERDLLLHPLPASTVNPAAIFGDTLYLGGMPERDFFSSRFYDQSSTLICLNLRTGEYKYRVPYPELYQGNTWGSHLAYFYNCFNPAKQIFVFSFPIDASLWITDVNGKMTNKFAGSTYLSEPSLPANKKLDIKERQKYYLSQPSFFAVYYDHYRDFYYRIAHHPLSDDEIANNKSIKKCSIVLLNGNLERMGEVLLPDGRYTETMVFVTEKGVFIGFYDQKNENSLSFRKFVLEESGAQ